MAALTSTLLLRSRYVMPRTIETRQHERYVHAHAYIASLFQVHLTARLRPREIWSQCDPRIAGSSGPPPVVAQRAAPNTMTPFWRQGQTYTGAPTYRPSSRPSRVTTEISSAPICFVRACAQASTAIYSFVQIAPHARTAPHATAYIGRYVDFWAQDNGSDICLP